MTEILVNLGPLKAGGGQTVAMAFVEEVVSRGAEGDFKFIVARHSTLDALCRQFGLNVLYRVSPNPIVRMIEEIFIVTRMIQKHPPKVIYSYFGFGCFISKVPQAIGAADSNIFYPEMDFWVEYSGVKKITKRLIDQFRIFGLTHADLVIFENPALMARAQKQLSLKNCCYIPPSIRASENSEDDGIYRRAGTEISILFLCGWQLNKNIMLIPQLLVAARKRGIDLRVKFSASFDGTRISREFRRQLCEGGVADKVEMLGTVERSAFSSLYASVDVVMLLSKLESFSNNISESWLFKTPLIITDADWSRAICGDAAIYVDRDKVDKVLDAVLFARKDTNRVSIVTKGCEELNNLPSSADRFDLELAALKRI